MLPDELSGLDPDIIEATLRICQAGLCNYPHLQKFQQPEERETFDRLVQENYITVKTRSGRCDESVAETQEFCCVTYKGLRLFLQLEAQGETQN